MSAFIFLRTIIVLFTLPHRVVAVKAGGCCATCMGALVCVCGQPFTVQRGLQIRGKLLLSVAQANSEPSPAHPTSCCFHAGDKAWVWQPPCRQPGQRLEGVLTSPPPRAFSVLPAGSPCSNTMVDRIKVTFLAVTVADNLSHEFNML